MCFWISSSASLRTTALSRATCGTTRRPTRCVHLPIDRWLGRRAQPRPFSRAALRYRWRRLGFARGHAFRLQQRTAPRGVRDLGLVLGVCLGGGCAAPRVCRGPCRVRRRAGMDVSRPMWASATRAGAAAPAGRTLLSALLPRRATSRARRGDSRRCSPPFALAADAPPWSAAPVPQEPGGRGRHRRQPRALTEPGRRRACRHPGCAPRL